MQEKKSREIETEFIQIETIHIVETKSFNDQRKHIKLTQIQSRNKVNCIFYWI